MTIESKLKQAAELLTEVHTELSSEKNTGEIGRDLKSYLAHNLAKKQQTNKEVFEHLLSAACYIVKGAGAGLTLFNTQKERLIFEAAIGIGAKDIVGYEVPLEGSVHGLAFALNETQVSASLHKQIDEQAQTQFDNVLVTPIRSGDNVIGTMSAVNKQGAEMFDQRDIEVFQQFALVVAALVEARLDTAIENPAMAEYDALLEQLVDTLSFMPPASITKILKALNGRD